METYKLYVSSIWIGHFLVWLDDTTAAWL